MTEPALTKEQVRERIQLLVNRCVIDCGPPSNIPCQCEALESMALQSLDREGPDVSLTALARIAKLPVHACDDARNAAGLGVAKRIAMEAIETKFWSDNPDLDPENDKLAYHPAPDFDAGLESAAVLADVEGDQDVGEGDHYMDGYTACAAHLAKAIRALKGTK